MAPQAEPSARYQVAPTEGFRGTAGRVFTCVITKDSSDISAAGSSKSDLLFATANRFGQHKLVASKRGGINANQRFVSLASLSAVRCISFPICSEKDGWYHKEWLNASKRRIVARVRYTCAALAENRFLLAARSAVVLLVLFGLLDGTTRLRADCTVSTNSRVRSRIP